MSETVLLLSITTFAILFLLLLVIKFKMHAFVALIIASMIVGLGAGMDPQQVLKSMESGMGGILGFVAVIVGLGAIFGQLLESSGGAETLAKQLLKSFGEKRATWALTIAGFIISIPIFMDIGIIMLMPVIYALSRKSKKSMLFYAIPLLAGMAVTHAFIPPTPGPVAVTQVLGASMGWVIIFGLIIGIPTAIVAGPVLGKYIGNKIMVNPPPLDLTVTEEATPALKKASFRSVVALVGLPLVLIMINTIVTGLELEGNNIEIDKSWERVSKLRRPLGPILLFFLKLNWVEAVQFIGHPFTALLIATLAASYWLGIRKGFDSKMLLSLANKALGPAGLIILVTGAGGMFKQILVDSGVGTALAESLFFAKSYPIVLAYLLAMIIRISQGSATVAMITSAGMVAPVLELVSVSDPHLALIVIATAAGATTFSHVNDSGFWLINKYLYLTEKQTLQSWSVVTSTISVIGFFLALLLSLVI